MSGECQVNVKSQSELDIAIGGRETCSHNKAKRSLFKVYSRAEKTTITTKHGKLHVSQAKLYNTIQCNTDTEREKRAWKREEKNERASRLLPQVVKLLINVII